MSAGLNAQQGQVPRDSFVFHVYVDPIYGEDLLALQQNPLHPERILMQPDRAELAKEVKRFQRRR